MDPRHPEQAISRMRELMKQYDRIEADMNKAMTSAKLAQLEREGGLVVQEICLVAPRIHEAMMQTSRQRRHDLSRGVMEKPVEKAFRRDDIVTEEGEKDFVRLKGILAEAEKKFNGKSAKNKETGVVYNYLRFMTIKPYQVDNIKYGIAVSIDDGKEEISFYNDKVTEFLNNYEPVEEKNPVENPEPTVEKCVNTPSKKLEKCDEIEVHATSNQAETVIVEPKPRKKSAKKKKTVKKAE